jgi:general L-amino acid transport system permease protein
VLFAGQKKNLSIILGVVGVFLVVTLGLAGAPVGAWIAALALVGGMLAIAQVQPGKLLWFTALFPALCFWLLWGGSVWVPIVALLGFAVMGVAYMALVARLGPTASALIGVFLALLWWMFIDVPLTQAINGMMPWGLVSVNSDQFGGFLLAITIGVTAITFSLPIGILLALGRQSDMLIVKTLCVGFIEFIRGVPLITLLFTASLLLQYFLPPNTSFDLILRVIILVTFFAAAYIAEVIRGGLAALPRGQYEAADSLGLDYWSAQRLIIMPQALKISIPGIVSTFIGLFKDTTLVAFVGLLDPLKGITQIVRADIAWKGIYWEPYIFVGAIFFVICFGMSRYSMYLEQKLKRDHR